VRKLKLGVAGLGRAFALTAPTLARDKRVELAAACDPRPEALRRFAADFHGQTFQDEKEFWKQPGIDAVYIATPHRCHAEQAIAAAAAGKHALVEKPMALTLDECRKMADAAKKHGVHLIAGPSHGFDAPIRRTKQLIPQFGRVRMITALNFTDFLYRPRVPEELEHALLNQAAHHVDIVRLLAGSPLKSVRANTAAWDRAQGAYSALLSFEDSFASLVYSGNAHFDSDEFTGWIGELGQKKDASQYGLARRALAGRDELQFKAARNYGGREYTASAAQFHEHFGPLIVSCDKADLRPLPNGIMIYADGERRLEPLPATEAPRAAVIDELYEAVVHGKAPLHDAAWGLATTEACLAILESATSGREVPLRHQTSAWRT
jgi:phthalate 4,5-cis-dihydrodiol dehydrogenase